MNPGFCCTSSYEFNLRKKVLNERNDCTVVALSLATNIPYKDAHAFLKSKGRQHGRGCYWNMIISQHDTKSIFGHVVKKTKYPYDHHERQFETIRGYSEYWGCPTVKYKYLDKRMNVKTFIQNNPKGKFVLEVLGHVLTVIDGVIHDYKNSQYREVEYSYEFIKQ